MFIFSLLFAVSAQAEFDHSHKLWNEFLKDHVVLIQNGTASQVNYEKALKNRKSLDAYIEQVTSVTQNEYDAMSPENQQALLINAYNALTIKLILDNNIPTSIKKLGGFLSTPWKKVFFKFLGHDAYLDHLEHNLARGKFNNCRFHFAFNCASVGCPMLRFEPYEGKKLRDQLEDASRRFMADSTRNKYDRTSNTVYISKIFDWYWKDFEKDPSCGSVKEFVRKYMMGQNIPEDVKVKSLDYDWNLNSTSATLSK